MKYLRMAMEVVANVTGMLLCGVIIFMLLSYINTHILCVDLVTKYCILH